MEHVAAMRPLLCLYFPQPEIYVFDKCVSWMKIFRCVLWLVIYSTEHEIDGKEMH